MRKTMKLSMLIAFLIGTTAWAQINNPSIIPVSSAPTGVCSGVLPAQIVISTGTIYTCQSGAWGAIGSGGGGGDTITSPNSSLTVGGTSTATTLDINLGHANTFTANQTAAKWIASTGFDITGAATTGHYLRNNGTDYVDSAIQTGDVPTLNQSTTGSAGSITTLSGLPSQSNDTVVMNATGSSASPTAVSMPTCTTGADLYNTTTHAWSCVSTGGGSGMTQLAQVVTAASATSISFASISGSYSNLKLNCYTSTQDTAQDYARIQFNSDTTAGDYQWGYVAGGAISPTSGHDGGSDPSAVVGLILNGASGFQPFNFEIDAYATTTGDKSYIGNAFSFNSASGPSSPFSLATGGWWKSTSAITAMTITLVPVGSTTGAKAFTNGSTCTLYGLL